MNPMTECFRMSSISKMADIAICLLKVSCIFAKNSSKNKCCLVPILCFALILPVFASHEKVTLIELSKLEKTSQKRLTAGDHSSGTDQINFAGHTYWGKLLDLGRENSVDGRLHLLPLDCSEDDSSVARLPDGWVAVLNYTDKLGTNTGTAGECPGVMERMKKALFFGASAIIILSLNPKIIKEIEMGQVFNRPVVLVDIAENITHMLHLLSGKLRLKARFLYNISQSVAESQKYFTTVTLWGTCGRYSGRTYHEWDGVVCLGHHEPQNNKDGKVDVENFWNYFYTAILVLMMLHYIRTRREQDWENPDYIDGQIRELAYRALAVMKIKRYTPDGKNDTCAICLERFYVKQKLRVLPCGHHFHTKCVDPWLVRNHTCPLCKLNIIEKLDSTE